MARVLLIEDDDGIRDLLTEELSDAGHDVIEAETGEKGLSAILDAPPDLVISDWLMPDMSGGELLQTLKSDHPQLSGMPFVLVSAFADKAHHEEGLELGADAYLTKPVDFELLLETVDKLLVAK